MRDKLIKYIGFFVAILGLITLEMTSNNYQKAINTYQQLYDNLQTKYDELTIAYLEKEQCITYEVVATQTDYPAVFTNYYVGDGSSTNKTGSGLKTSDFEINSDGFYTYKGKVVVATATWEGINSDYGVLADVHDVPKGYT